MLWVSQVAHGQENALKLRVYGERGGLEWAQEEPDRLWFAPEDQPKRLFTRGGAGMEPEAARIARIPGGHPEGYLEGFATLYAEIARAIAAARGGDQFPPKWRSQPSRTVHSVSGSSRRASDHLKRARGGSRCERTVAIATIQFNPLSIARGVSVTLPAEMLLFRRRCYLFLGNSGNGGNIGLFQST